MSHVKNAAKIVAGAGVSPNPMRPKDAAATFRMQGFHLLAMERVKFAESRFKSMNKSEIAEKAAREIVNEHIDSGACASSKAERKAIERDAIAAIKLRVERAIAESQAAQPCSSNSITLGRNSDEPEPEKCPTCNGYHLGGCHRKAKLGDGELSPIPTGSFCGKCGADLVHGCNADRCIVERSGAAQEVSPVGYVSEIRPRPADPSCHVCGAQMAVKEWKCRSCKATTGVEEVSPPSPEPDEPDAFQEAWAKYNKAGLSTGWERVGFVGGFKHGFDVGRKSAEGDTRELKAALKCGIAAVRTASSDNPDWVRLKMQFLIEAERLLG